MFLPGKFYLGSEKLECLTKLKGMKNSMVSIVLDNYFPLHNSYSKCLQGFSSRYNYPNIISAYDHVKVTI